MYVQGFRFYFTPLTGVLFAFPSQYWFTIGQSGVFSLGGWSPHLQTGFLVSRPTYRKLSTTTHTSNTGLSPCVAWLPSQFFCIYCYHLLATPLSLAATHRISIDFFSSGYLDVSVLPVCLTSLFYLESNDRFFIYRVSPFGYLGLNASYQLIQAFRRLARPSSPLIAKASALYAFSLNYTTSRIFILKLSSSYMRCLLAFYQVSLLYTQNSSNFISR